MMTRLLLYSTLLLLTFIPQHLLAQQSKVIELKITGEATEFDKDQQMRLIRVSDGVVIDSVPLKARRFEKVLRLPTSEPYYELCTVQAVASISSQSQVHSRYPLSARWP